MAIPTAHNNALSTESSANSSSSLAARWSRRLWAKRSKQQGKRNQRRGSSVSTKKRGSSSTISSLPVELDPQLVQFCKSEQCTEFFLDTKEEPVKEGFDTEEDVETLTLSTDSVNSVDETDDANNERTVQCVADTTTHSCASDHSSKQVHFGTATVYYHNLILGDSPSVSKGVPLALGHQCVSTETLDVNDMMTPSTNWGGSEPLLIPSKARKTMLLDEGIPHAALRRYEQYQDLAHRNPTLAARLYPDLA